MDNLINIKNNFNEKLVLKFFQFLDVQSKDTLRTYKNGISNFMEYIKNNNISQPSRDDIVNWKLQLKEQHKASTVNTYLVAVKSLFNFLEMYGLYPNISKFVKSYNVSVTPKKNVLTQEQIQVIYNGLEDLREKALFGLLITTGLRGCEVATAKIENIKEVNDEYCLFVKRKGHSEDDEYVKLADNILNDIIKYIGTRSQGNIFISESNRNNNQPISILTIRRLIKNIFKRFGIDDETISLHSTRRTFACECYNLGQSIYDIQQVLAHKNIATTTRYLKQVDRNNNNSEKLVASILTLKKGSGKIAG